MELKGKKVILVLRSSTEEQAAKSIPQQREADQQYADQMEMVIVDEVVLPGYSANLLKRFITPFDTSIRSNASDFASGVTSATTEQTP